MRRPLCGHDENKTEPNRRQQKEEKRGKREKKEKRKGGGVTKVGGAIT